MNLDPPYAKQSPDMPEKTGGALGNGRETC